MKYKPLEKKRIGPSIDPRGIPFSAGRKTACRNSMTVFIVRS